MMPHSAVLIDDERAIVKDALLMYISDLQGKYYRDRTVDPDTYLGKLSDIESIVEKLNLKEIYK